MRTVRLYSRPGCHLCEESKEILDRLAASYNFTVEEISIHSDRDLYLRYWSLIPVVEIGESVVPAALDEDRLKSVLDWEFRNAPTPDA